MCSIQKLMLPRRKRNHVEAGLETDSTSESQPPKRYKLHSAEFYDSLTKVWLTRRALKELDRRTSQASNPQPPVAARRQIFRDDTWKRIKRFARHGGPDLRDLRGHPASATLIRTMRSSHFSGSRQAESTVPKSKSSKTRRSSAYDKDFEQHIVDYKIYPEGYNYSDGRKTPEPILEGIHQRLALPRPSISPSQWSDSNFKDFERTNAQVIDEGEVMRHVVPIIVGNSDILNKQNLLFTRLDPITNNTTVDAKPDFYDGARPRDVDKRLRDDIGNFIIPTGHSSAPVAPNFFLEVKRPSGGADVAKRQACYNGALGARGMHQLQSDGHDEPVYDGNAYTLTSTFHAGNLNIYTTHVTSSGPGSSPEYHMSQVGGWNLIGDSDTCRRGVAAFRNGRDLAQEQRDAFISAANEKVRTTIVRPASFELSLDESASDSIDVQDTAYPTKAADPVNDGQYYMSQPILEDERIGYLHTEPSTFAPSDFYDRSDEEDAYAAEESETSSDELALETFPEPSNKKQQQRSSKRMALKVPRHSDDTTRRRHRSKQ